MSRQLIIKPGARFTNSSEVLTYYIIGPYAGWSVGSNILSDIYLDFGTIGVVLMMGMIGWFVAWSRGAIVTHGLSMKRIFIYVATLAYVGELPRYTFDAPVRLLVWGIILISLYELVFLRRGRKKSFAKNEEDEVSKTPGTSSLP